MTRHYLHIFVSGRANFLLFIYCFVLLSMKRVFKEIPFAVCTSFIVKEEKAVQFAAPFHFHDGYEFTFIVNGQGKFYGGNQVMNFTDGDVYFFGPLFPHYFVNEKSFVESQTLGHSIAVQFKDDFLGKDSFQQPEFRRIKALLDIAHLGIKVNTPDTTIKNLLFQLVQQHGAKRIILLLELLDGIAELQEEDVTALSLNTHNTYDSVDRQKSFSKLDAVYRFVLENFKENVTSKKAASLAYLNEAAFCRYFKRQTKKTFSQFVNQVRIVHATSLLLDKNLNVGDVCYQCGFNSISYFNRQFKYITGQSPLAYRKIHTD